MVLSLWYPRGNEIGYDLEKMLSLRGAKSWPMPLATENCAKKVRVIPRTKNCIPSSSNLTRILNVLKFGSRISFWPRDSSGFIGREYFKKKNWYYGLKRKGGLVIGDAWVLFGVSVRILKLVWQVTWSKVIICKARQNPYQDDGTTRGSKEESKDGVSLSPSRCFLNLEDEIHLKGVEL